MTKQKYIIDYENAHFCGGQLNVVVWAHNPEEAQESACIHMEEEQRELFSAEYDPDNWDSDEDYHQYDDECAYSVNSVELFNEDHSDYAYFLDPSQESFYPVIGQEDD